MGRGPGRGHVDSLLERTRARDSFCVPATASNQVEPTHPRCHIWTRPGGRGRNVARRPAVDGRQADFFGAPDRLATLQKFVQRFRPFMWSGSRAAILALRSQLLGAFELDDDHQLAAYVRSARIQLEREAERERSWEAGRSREQDERFE